MGNVRVNFSSLEKFKGDIEKLAQSDMQSFYESCAKELAARLLSKVIKRTPAITGSLRRGWTSYDNIEVIKRGNCYQITIINSMEYASYVEYGHRQEPGRYVPAIGKKLKAGWVPGKFMLTISEQELQSEAPAVLEKKLANLLKEAF